jgi:glycosyltransferase involved in cell wall biosynthesis
MTPILFDITRSISRFGLGQMTGIDRVERTYLNHLSTLGTDVWLFAKVGKKFNLVPPDNVPKVIAFLNNEITSQRVRLKDKLRLKLTGAQQRARTFLRDVSITEFSVANISKNLELVGAPFRYINTGHSNLSNDVLGNIQSAQCCKISILIHDMIPLDFPEYTKQKMIEDFGKRMQSVAKFANEIICNSEHTRDRVVEHFVNWGAAPEMIVAHLGLDQSFLDAQGTAEPIQPAHFVFLGTVEGRKNHKLIFDIWTDFEIPYALHVVGRRGWQAEEAISFLSNSELIGKTVFEHSDMSDRELKDLIAGASALVFPSYTEGFGLPAIEARALGVQVIASDIPALREVLGDKGVFIDPMDKQGWLDAISLVIQGRNSQAIDDWKPPTWDTHFKLVFG